MNNTLRLISIAFFLSLQDLCAQWQEQILPLEPFEDLYGISFLNDNDYFICSNTEVSHTTNGGANWQVENLLEGFPFLPFVTNTLYDLHFYNSTSGIATGVFNLTNNEIVIRTDNGNQSWNQVYLNASLIPPVYFNDLDVRGQQVLVCGKDGHIIRSTDGGNSFLSTATVSGLSLSDILFLDDNRAIAIGQNNVLRSENGGENWAFDPQFAGKGAWSIARADANTLYMASEGALLRSSDNGASFSAVSQVPVPGGIGLLAASNDTLFTTNGYGICISVDGGVFWQKIKNTQGLQVNRLVIRNGKLYVLCDGARLIVMTMTNLVTQPIAFMQISLQQECGKTTLLGSTPNDTSKVSLAWFLNNVPDGNGPTYSRAYTAFQQVNQVLTLVLTDKSTLQSDTISETPGIPFWELPTAYTGADQYLCYGSRAVVPTGGYFYQYQWVTDNVIDLPFSGNNNTIEGDITYPLSEDVQLVLKTWTESHCVAYDTVQLFIGEAYQETFHYSDPVIPNTCSNASCAYLPDLQFVNEHTGYGMSSNGVFIKTTDAGKTWTKTNFNSGLAAFSPVGSLDFIDEMTGFTVNPNRKTTDGGQTFTPVVAPQDIYGYTHFVDFVDVNTGLYVVNNPFSPGFSSVFKTSNGGQSYQNILGCNFQLKDIEFLNAQTIFVAGGYSYYGTVLKSSNGGQSWDTIPIPNPDLVVWSIDAVSEDTFFIHNGYYIQRTYDNGASWHSFFFPYGAGKVEMLNSQVGYASGYNNKIYKTVNGGECWTEVFSATYPLIDAIAFSPSGNSVYFSTNDYNSNRGPVVYHAYFYRNFGAALAPVSCVGTPLRTQNKSFGYTHYRWYLDGVFCGDTYDVEKTFNTEGDHVFKMVADSAGLFLDSIELQVHIKAAPSTIGQIEGPRGLCGIQMFQAQYVLPENNQYVYYQWSITDFPQLSGGSGSPNNDRSFTLVSWPGSGEIGLQVFARDSIGCYSDTASALISVVNSLPPDPVFLELSEYCHILDASDISNGNSIDSIGYSTGTAPLVSGYYLYKNDIPMFDLLVEPVGRIPTYLYCAPEFAVYQLRNANACGLSAGFATDSLLTGYENISVSHSNDTIVQAGEPVTLLAKAQLDTIFQGFCWPVLPEWYFEGQALGWISESYPLLAAPENAGVWTAKFYNGCDTVAVDIHLDVTTGVEGPDNNIAQLTVAPNPNNGSFVVTLPQAAGSDAVLRLYDASGRALQDIPLQQGLDRQQITLSDLPAGLYGLQWIGNGQLKAAGRFVRG